MNALKTRQDVVDAAVELLRPLVACLTPGKARMIAGNGSAHYSEDVAGMEGFSRALWAIVPMLMGHCPEAEPFWEIWKQGIVHGTDPAHEEYWGDLHDSDQRMVEMAVMGMGLCFVPERFWEELSPAEQDNLYAWLNQINRYDMPKNNWRYFRILVNTGFLKVGLPVDEARMKEDLDMMESHYVGDGWYFDYETKRDYYTIWGFHYYDLVYAAAMRDRDAARAARFEERARLIAPRFACWFDREGRALPYGRSLTYRFAQGAFWSVMAFADTRPEGMSWGRMKGLWLKNLRSWLALPIRDRDGVLTVGYGYPNLCMAEGYNAPGSPYWGMKTFAALALPEEHPFWQAEEEDDLPPRRFLDAQVRMLLTRDRENRQVIAYTAGNHGWEHMHEDEKYEKFAYSTQFTFSIAKEATTLEKGGYDSMLAVKRKGRDLWHGRSGCEEFEMKEDRVRFRWSPLTGVEIESVILPVETAEGLWHLRKHVIRTEIPLETAEGAFAIRRDWAGARPCDRIASALRAEGGMAAAHGAFGSSGIFSLEGNREGRMIWMEPNTNLMYPRTQLPMLTGEMEKGTHTLVCAVFADSGDACPTEIPKEVLAHVESL